MTSTLNDLGYTRRDNSWIHEDLGFFLSKPEALDGCTPAALAPIHEASAWRRRAPPAPPAHDAALAAALAANGFEWAGWLGAWEAPTGELIPHVAIEELGTERLAGLAAAREAWTVESARRQRLGCVGMGAMLAWVSVGWLAGQWIWLTGMAVIGLVAWKNRPLVRMPEDWAELEGVDLEGLMDAAADALPEGWEDLPEVTGVLDAGGGWLYLPQLDRCLNAQALAAFDRNAFEALLTALAPTTAPH